MVHTFVRLKVDDYSKWRTTYDESISVREKAGCISGSVFRSSNDPFEVFLLLKWDELERVRQFATSPHLQEIMKRTGVTENETYFMSEV